ncbi:hypothetical protein MTO96_011368 [Rhipicephalus appendiculatus]
MDLVEDKSELSGPAFLSWLKQAYTEQDISNIESSTRLQAQSPLWMQHRKGMVTASIARACLTRTQSLKKEPRPHNWRGVVNLVMYSSTFKSAAMKDGSRKEAEVKLFYMSSLEKSGHAASLTDVGLKVFKDIPFIGASPDVVISFTCECCREKVRALEMNVL